MNNTVLHQKNSKKQGDVGLGLAIGYFSCQGSTVSIPLTDSQDYDLIIDDGTKLQRVQVRTTRFKHQNGKFGVNLRVNGGNRTGYNKSKTINHNSVEILFIITSDLSFYLIPINEITATCELTLCEKYEKFKVIYGPNE